MYLPNLMAFNNSSRRLITDLVVKDYATNKYEAQQTKSSKTYLANLTAFRKSSRRWTKDFIFKDLPRNKYAAQTM